MMTKHDAAKAFVERCTAVENLEPVALEEGAPVLIGGSTYRAAYDLDHDAVVLMPDRIWRQRLERARDVVRERVVDLNGGESLRIREGGREWVVSYDGLVDEFVCAPAKKG